MTSPSVFFLALLSALAATPATIARTSAKAPELPRTTVDTKLPAVTGKAIVVKAGDNLQRALDRARRGDEVVLEAGATFEGKFTLPAKEGSAANGWITVRTSGIAQLPAGTRVTPANAPAMARILGVEAGAGVIHTEAGATGWRLIGLEIGVARSVERVGAIVSLGDGSREQQSVAKAGSELILDRVYVHGTPTLQVQRCVALNSGSAAVIDSWLSDCHARGADSQAIAGWNGPGPYLIENNYLEGAGENIMFGGADPAIPDLIPSDITIRRNHLTKPREWKGRWTVKNLFELKNARRVLVEGNVMEHCWIDAQTGVAVVLKSTNQSGRAPWSRTTDVTFRYNIVRNAASGVTLAGHPEQHPAEPMARVLLEHNVFSDIGEENGTKSGRMIMLLGDLQDVAIRRNTWLHNSAGLFILMERKAVPAQNLEIVGNVTTWGGSWGPVMVSNGPQGNAGLAQYASSATFDNNVIIGLPANLRRFYTSGATIVGSLADAGFADVRSGNLRLSGRHRGVGADFDALEKLTQGVVTKSE